MSRLSRRLLIAAVQGIGAEELMLGATPRLGRALAGDGGAPALRAAPGHCGLFIGLLTIFLV